jgi:hypothetical protein
MNIETLEKIKKTAVEALAGRKKLHRLHSAYMEKIHKGTISRAQTTTYNASASDVMQNQVIPAETLLKKLIRYNND